jgi:hypothetical protein
MKTIVRILTTAAAVILMANFASAQEDRCIGGADRSYLADSDNATPTFAWSLELPGGGDGAAYLSDANTDECTIDWDNAALTDGTYTLSVIESYLGCDSDPITLTIIVHAKPTATITVADDATVCSGEATPNISVALTGTANWTITYAINAVDQAPVGPIAASPYALVVPDGITLTSAYTITAVSDAYCADGTGVGTVTFTVPDFSTTTIVPQ